jgi:hypothetical protein
MKIYLDFDGTVVEHDYPRIGRNNYGCMEVIKKLQNAGNEVILNSYRSECDDGTLEQALKYLNENSWMFFKDKDNDLDKIENFTIEKIIPPAWNWEYIKENNEIFIDDIASGIPLKPCCMIENSMMVDWDELDKQFIENGIYLM